MKMSTSFRLIAASIVLIGGIPFFCSASPTQNQGELALSAHLQSADPQISGKNTNKFVAGERRRLFSSRKPTFCARKEYQVPAAYLYQVDAAGKPVNGADPVTGLIDPANPQGWIAKIAMGAENAILATPLPANDRLGVVGIRQHFKVIVIDWVTPPATGGTTPEAQPRILNPSDFTCKWTVGGDTISTYVHGMDTGTAPVPTPLTDLTSQTVDFFWTKGGTRQLLEKAPPPTPPPNAADSSGLGS